MPAAGCWFVCIFYFTNFICVFCCIPLLFQQEEDRLRAKEEQERQEEEEYLRLKASFVVEEQGEEDQLTEDQVTSSLPTSRHIIHIFENCMNICFLSFQSRNLLKEFIQYIEVGADNQTHACQLLKWHINVYKNCRTHLLGLQT